MIAETLKQTLDAALAKITKTLDGYLRDASGERIGVFRWLPATEEEAQPIAGSQIDAVAIEQMARSLNGRATAIPIDGGPRPSEVEDAMVSEVHGTAKTGGGTPANGWAHAAVVHEGADGVTELYLWAELFPSIAREIDAGRLAFGSVHFGFDSMDGTAPRDVVLISHALTNDPAVTTLSPANDIRARNHLVAHYATRTRTLHMTKPAAKKPNTRSAHVGKRINLVDSEGTIASLLPDVAPEDLGTEVIKLVASYVERMSEPEGAPMMIEASARAAAAPMPPVEPAAGAGEAAALELMRDLIGQPGATLAEAIDTLKALSDPIKAIISSGPDAAAQNQANAAAQSSADHGDLARSARMGEHDLRSRVTTLEAARAADAKELTALRSAALRSRVDGEIAVSLRNAKRVMSDEQIASLAADLVGVADDAVRARHLARAVGGGAPTGVVMGHAGEASRTGSHAAAPLGLTIKSVTDAEEQAAREQLTARRRPVTASTVRSLAQRLAASKHPELFEAAGSSADSAI